MPRALQFHPGRCQERYNSMIGRPRASQFIYRGSLRSMAGINGRVDRGSQDSMVGMDG
jgi:hypothetical protein